MLAGRATTCSSCCSGCGRLMVVGAKGAGRVWLLLPVSLNQIPKSNNLNLVKFSKTPSNLVLAAQALSLSSNSALVVQFRVDSQQPSAARWSTCSGLGAARPGRSTPAAGPGVLQPQVPGGDQTASPTSPVVVQGQPQQAPCKVLAMVARCRHKSSAVTNVGQDSTATPSSTSGRIPPRRGGMIQQGSAGQQQACRCSAARV